MRYTAQLHLSDALPPIGLLYVAEEFPDTDTTPALYEEHKLSIMLSDGLAAVLGSTVCRTVRGDLLVFRPDEIHFGRFFHPGVYRYIDFYIPPALTEALSDGCASLLQPFRDDAKDRVHHLRPPAELREQLLRLAEDAAALSQSADPADGAVAYAKVLELLGLCRTLYAEQKLHPVPDTVPAVVSHAIQTITAEFARPLTLQSIAEKSGCSVSYLTRTFRRHTGKSVYAFLTEYRLLNARRALENGASVTEACYASGFGDCSDFIRIFREWDGRTPGRCRRDACGKVEK